MFNSAVFCLHSLNHCFRQGQELPQKILFQKAKFASFLVDNFIPYSQEFTPDRSAVANNEIRMKRIASRGLIMNCANAIRLQLSCQPPSSFLPSFFATHPKWSDFLADLVVRQTSLVAQLHNFDDGEYRMPQMCR